MKTKANNVETRRKVMVFASQIYRWNKSWLTWGEAMSYAWSEIRQQPEAQLVTFEKNDGSVSSYVVLTNWKEYVEVKGTGRPTKPGQILFVDLARLQSGFRNPTISTYRDRITPAYFFQAKTAA